MKKMSTLLLMLAVNFSIYSADLVLNDFNTITCPVGVSGALGSEWTTVESTGKVTIPANNEGEYVYFSLPANFDVNNYQFLKLSVKSAQTNYRFVPALMTSSWSESADWNATYKYTGAGVWQDVYISLGGMTPGIAGTYDKIALKVAAYDSKPTFDLYVDNVTLVEKYVPDNNTDIIVCNFDNVISPMSSWGGNSIFITTNPNGAGNVGVVSVPANNDGGITLTSALKINTTTHDRISFKVYANQAFTINYEKLEDNSNSSVNTALDQYPAYTTPNQWQEMVLDVSGRTSNIYDKIVLFAEAWQGKPAFTFYIDEVMLVKKVVSSLDKNVVVNFGVSYAAGFVNIKTDRSAVIEILSISGVVVKRAMITGDTSINVSDLNNGIYLIRNLTDGNVTKVLKN